MFYNLLVPYVSKYNVANLFSYITFRSCLAVVVSMLITILVAPKIISYLKSKQKKGQPIRDDGPETHFAKAGTPTMGGLIIILSTTISILFLANLTDPYIWLLLFVLLLFGMLGFIDDYKKVSKDNYRGISSKYKLFIQLVASIIIFVVIQKYSSSNFYSKLSIPFLKNTFLNLGYFYIPFIMCVIVGSSNAVNLTDGLDGLATGSIIIAMSAFALISYVVGNSIYSHYLHVIHIESVGEVAVFCSAIIGSCLGFLWYNAKPAEIFMGDTGSLALGGVLGTISVITKHELVLCIIGGVFVMETVSVILQVGYFKYTGGKRIFLMAPIHHHFEKKGLPESKIVIRFWILAVIFALIGLSSLKLR